ncbi:MAG: hypothetical protein LUP97_03565 [Methanoregula sp.]|nr:hypothetical protein [Methanoregula sp.]
MIEIIVARAKGFMLSPVETFRQSKPDEPASVFTSCAVLLADQCDPLSHHLGCRDRPDNILRSDDGRGRDSSPDNRLLRDPDWRVSLNTCLCRSVSTSGSTLLAGAKGIIQTVHAILSASMPRLLPGGIPLLSAIFVLWTIEPDVLGIRELQELSPGKAIAAVVIAISIPLICIIIAAWFFTTLVIGVRDPDAARKYLVINSLKKRHFVGRDNHMAPSSPVSNGGFIRTYFDFR